MDDRWIRGRALCEQSSRNRVGEQSGEDEQERVELSYQYPPEVMAETLSSGNDSDATEEAA